MRLSENLRFIFVMLILVVPFTTSATTSHTYVLAYEGTIDGDATKIESEIKNLFNELDPAKVSTEIIHQNYPNTNVYTIEGSFEPKSEQAIAYVEGFAQNHKEFTVGNVKIHLRLATNIVEFLSVECFGPDQSGENEISWGTFVRYRQFPSVSDYFTSVVQLGITLSQGNENEIRTNLIPILNPVDSKSFQEWMDGNGKSKPKMARFQWDSRSFFILEDGSFVSRPMAWHVERKLDNLP